MSDQYVKDHSPAFTTTISRRESLQWLGLMMAGGALGPAVASASAAAGNAGHWPALKLTPITAASYGTDPDLVSPVAPWPRTLASQEMAAVAIVADILLPGEDDLPAATELHIPDVVDEWVSAPYESQQADRTTVLSLLRWLDDEAGRRFKSGFAGSSSTQRLQIIEDIAWLDTAPEFQRAASAFDTLRRIVLAAFYCTPQGAADIGYLGGKVIAGDYPGPSSEAERHLREILAELKLEPFADPAA